MAVYYLQIGAREDTYWGGVDVVNELLTNLIPDNHEYLFQFIDFDLSHTEHLTEEYLKCLETGRTPNRETLGSIIRDIQKLHPYFIICRENAASLLNRIFAGYIKRKFSDLDEQEHKNMFLKICVSDYSMYADPDENYDSSIDSCDPYILDYLYDLQMDIKKWVFLTIDNTNPTLAKISTQRRSALYSHIYQFDENVPLLSFSAEFSTIPSKRMRDKSIHWDFGDLDAAKEKAKKNSAKNKPAGLVDATESHYQKLYDEVELLMLEPDGAIPKTMLDVLDATKDIDDCNVVTYEIRDFQNLLELEVYTMIMAETRIKRCEICNQYFVLSDPDQKYCDRIAPNSSKSCLEVGREKDNNRGMPVEKRVQALYRRAYQTHHQRLVRGTMSQDDFERWKIDAQEKGELTKRGEMDIEDYAQWVTI